MTDYFILFDNKYYWQHNGVAMSFSLGAERILSIFLYVTEQAVWIKKCLPECRPVTYKRYDNDTFLLSQDIIQIEKLKNYSHLYHAIIKFISEIEMNSSLSFIDFKIIRENKFTTSVYHKPIFGGGVLTNFESFITQFVQCSLIVTLLHKAFKLRSNFDLFHREIEI